MQHLRDTDLGKPLCDHAHGAVGEFQHPVDEDGGPCLVKGTLCLILEHNCSRDPLVGKGVVDGRDDTGVLDDQGDQGMGIDDHIFDKQQGKLSGDLGGLFFARYPEGLCCLLLFRVLVHWVTVR